MLRVPLLITVNSFRAYFFCNKHPYPITHITSVSKKRPTTERLLTYINKSSATNCDETTVQDTLCILRTKNLIDENLKLLCENNKLVDDKIPPTPVPGTPNSPTKDKNRFFDIVLNDVEKDLVRHVNGEVENLKALIDNEFTTRGQTSLLTICHLQTLWKMRWLI